MAPTIPACDGRTIAEGFTYKWRDPHRGETPDDRDYGEERWIATGRVDLAVLAVVFADRGGRQRIISARRAKRREEEAYDEDRLGFGARF